jgi:hypothetical protein
LREHQESSGIPTKKYKIIGMEDKVKEEVWLIFKEATLSRFRLLPEIASIATALLVVATFNPELLPLTHDIKLALSILLLLIPLSLDMFLWEANEASVEAAKSLERLVPGFSGNVISGWVEFIFSRAPMKRKARVLYPYFVVVCIFVFVLLFIFHIWN